MISRTLLLGSLRNDTALMMAAALAAGPKLDQPVDACPEWDLAALLGHAGGVYGFATAVLENRTGPGQRPTPPEDRAELVDWFGARAEGIIAALDKIDDDEPCWNWATGTPQVGRFWVRRMPQESAVHRFDAELAATGTAETIDPELAVDGIDEYLDIFLPRKYASEPVDIGTFTVHLHATDDDVEGEWLVQMGGLPVVTRGHEKGDIALRGDAQELLLALWGRLEPNHGGLVLHGDRALWDKFRTATAI